VYINNNVEEINAIIYADGALRSARVNGSAYQDAEIENRLRLY
jgi:hypothetical protein